MREGRGAVGAEGGGCGRGILLPLVWGLGMGLCPLPRKIFNFLNKNGVFGALWDTVFKLMCLQRKALHQTSMQCSRRCAGPKKSVGGQRVEAPKASVGMGMGYPSSHSTIGGLGERHELPRRGMGRSPSAKRI